MEIDLNLSYRAGNTLRHHNKIQKSNSIQGNVILLLDERNTRVHSLGSMYGFRDVKRDGARSAHWELEGVFSLE
jgi:hypothetical protein